MPQGAKGAFPERGAAAPMNAPRAHLRSAARAAPKLFRTLVARSATPERRSQRRQVARSATPERRSQRRQVARSATPE